MKILTCAITSMLLFGAAPESQAGVVFDIEHLPAIHVLRPGTITMGKVKFMGSTAEYLPDDGLTLDDIHAVDLVALAKTKRKLKVWREMESRIKRPYSPFVVFLINKLGTQAEKDAMLAVVQPIWQDAKQARIDIEALETVAEVKAFTW